MEHITDEDLQDMMTWRPGKYKYPYNSTEEQGAPVDFKLGGSLDFDEPVPTRQYYQITPKENENE